MIWKRSQLQDQHPFGQQGFVKDGPIAIRPIEGPFIDRVKNAWAVLRGRLEVFDWNA